MKVRTLGVAVIDTMIALAILDDSTNDFCKLHRVISIGGNDFLPINGIDQIPIIARTIVYEDDELRAV